ncbi:hypothetical protein AA0473_1178 [Acetobacter orleanensis NRIC 0473]|nr:hypothetical protein AA0473_1178 [Acetobacter orleanensis NRIC 0473]
MAYTGFVAVTGGGINQAIPGEQGSLHGSFNLLIIHRVCAKPHSGDFVTVIEGKKRG